MKRLHIATPGASYKTQNKKLVNELVNTGNFILTHIYYTKRKWWQFWKIKKPVSYELICIKDLEN